MAETKIDTKETSPLWKQPLEVIGLTGDYGSGKSLFGLSICPGPETLVFDTEKSTKTYQPSLNFHRVDIADMMLSASKGGGYKPVDVFERWLAEVRAVDPGKYRVIVLDTVSEIESGLVSYVRKCPQEFGLSAGQIAKAEGLVWGAVKDFWKSILADIAARCETFVFTAHLKSVWAGGRPTTKQAPKGKETLMELASLYLWLDRSSDKKGIVPAVPSATVLKSRLTSFGMVDGEFKAAPTLPPRLPMATPGAIRQYMEKPPNYAKLTAKERVEIHQPTEAELEEIRLARAEAERDAEIAKSSNNELIERSRQKQTEAQKTEAPTQPKKGTEKSNGKNANGKATREQLLKLAEYKSLLGIPKETWLRSLGKRGVDSAYDLTSEQATEMLGNLSNIHQKGLIQQGGEQHQNDRSQTVWKQLLGKEIKQFGESEVYEAGLKRLGYPVAWITTRQEANGVSQALSTEN